MKISSAGLLTASSAAPVTPDFKIHTSAMEIDPEHGNIVRMIGSSTERDLHGDTMAVSALSDMAQVESGLTIWLNHSYDLPNDLFGSLLESPRLELQNGIADIHITSDVEMDNPAALQTLKLVKNGRKLGCSIGCMILEAEVDNENDDGMSWWPPLIILHVQVLEWSVVGIPANQRCWAEMGTKGLFERMVNEGRGDEALALAPAVKGLYPRAYDDRIKKVDNQALRRDLERVEVRTPAKERIEWKPDERVFAMNTKGVYKPMKRDEVTAFLAKSGERPRVPLVAKQEVEQTAKEAEVDPTITTQEETQVTDEAIAVPATDAETKDTNASFREGDTVTLASTGELATVKSVDEQGSVTLAAFEEAKETAPIVFKEEEQAPVQKAEATPVNEMEVQMYNLLASKLGMPQLTMSENGTIEAWATVKAFPELTPEAIQEAIAATLNFGETVKSGSQFSKKNQQTLQSLHNSIVDMCKSQFHPCEEMAGDDEEDNPDDGDEQKQFSAELLTANSEIPALREDFKALIDTLKSQGHLVDPKAIKDMQNRVDAADRRLKDIQATTNQAEERLANLQNAPLGQPTLLKRGIQNNGDIVTHDDFKALSAGAMNANERRWSLDEALKATIVVPRPLASGESMQCRKWPAGVGGSVKDGVRPELTRDQRMWMHPSECLSYSDGEEAAVPCYDDPLNVEA